MVDSPAQSLSSSASVECQPQCVAGTVLEKLHPLEENGCVGFGRAATNHFQNSGQLSFPRGLASLGVECADCLSVSESGHPGEQSGLAVGGGKTAENFG